jgi:hypothetical protein
MEIPVMEISIVTKIVMAPMRQFLRLILGEVRLTTPVPLV